MRRAKKELFASSQALMEAQRARDSSCLVSYYYLCYYSLLHVMQAVLYLNIDLSENVVGLSHTQIQKIFVDYYAKGENCIIDNCIEEMLIEYRYLREYSLYNTPFNSISRKVDEKQLIRIIKQCMQLANFHSLLLKNTGHLTTSSNENFYDIKKSFKIYNAKKSPDNQYEYDVSDNFVLNEMLQCGCSFECFSLDLDHDFDEYGLYGLDINNFPNKEAYLKLKVSHGGLFIKHYILVNKNREESII